jgi:hypothetical protein
MNFENERQLDFSDGLARNFVHMSNSVAYSSFKSRLIRNLGAVSHLSGFRVYQELSGVSRKVSPP